MKTWIAAACAACSICLVALAWADPDPTRAQAGFVFVKPAAGKAQLRESPDPASKVVGTPATGARLVYRQVAVAEDDSTSWYRVEPPGGTPGWLSIADSSDKRLTRLPPARPMRVIDSGIRSSSMKGSATAAARGFDGRAAAYAEEKDLKKAADHFITLERFVERQFSDPHAKDFTYPEKGPALAPRAKVRKDKADKFKAEVR